jgi:uncharacterized protein
LDPVVFEHFRNCHEIWHAGDFGSIGIAAQLSKAAPVDGKVPLLRGVYGNVDGQDIKTIYPQQIVFNCEKVKVLMRHIGGYPPRYNPETKKELLLHQPQLFICGHSHILKVMYDETLSCLYMNPGAAGKYGWHKVRTLIRFVIDGSEIKDCEVVELN